VNCCKFTEPFPAIVVKIQRRFGERFYFAPRRAKTMQTSQSTTPHGRRPYSLASWKHKSSRSPARRKPSPINGTFSMTLGKPRTYSAFPTARGGSQRSSFLPPGNDPYRWGADRCLPLEQEPGTAVRTVCRTSLRRYLGRLVYLGFILRRDSPNGKRYARRGEGVRSKTPSASILVRSLRVPPNSNAWRPR